MARPLRIEYENASYHVMNHGKGRQWIYSDTDYYGDFLQGVEEAHQRFGIEVLAAYCLIGNHYHILIHTLLCWCHRRANITTGIHGVLAPNAPLRRAVTAYAALPLGVDAVSTDQVLVTTDDPPEAGSNKRSSTAYLWVMLIARIYEVFPLVCPHCTPDYPYDS